MTSDAQRRNLGEMRAHFWFTAGFALTFVAPAAEACVRPSLQSQLHAVRPEARELDQTPPGAPRVAFAQAWRRAAEVCHDGQCTASSCGDTAALEIHLQPDDGGSSNEPLGYRLELVAGQVPPSMQPWLNVALSSRSVLLVPVDDREIEQLDAVLQVVAVDEAGNESLPSEPFVARYEGCSKDLFGDECQLDCAWAAENAGSSAEAVAAPCHQGLHCSVTSLGKQSPGGWWLLTALAGLQILRRSRRS